MYVCSNIVVFLLPAKFIFKTIQGDSNLSFQELSAIKVGDYSMINNQSQLDCENIKSHHCTRNKHQDTTAKLYG